MAQRKGFVLALITIIVCLVFALVIDFNNSIELEKKAKTSINDRTQIRQLLEEAHIERIEIRHRLDKLEKRP